MIHKVLWLIGILDYVRTDGALYRTYMNSFKTVTRCLKHSSIVMTVTFACRGWVRAYFCSALIENELRKCGSEHHNNASTSVHRAATTKVKAITKNTREITVKFISTFEGSSSIRIYSCFQRAEQNCGSLSVYSSASITMFREHFVLSGKSTDFLRQLYGKRFRHDR